MESAKEKDLLDPPDLAEEASSPLVESVCPPEGTDATIEARSERKAVVSPASLGLREPRRSLPASFANDMMSISNLVYKQTAHAVYKVLLKSFARVKISFHSSKDPSQTSNHDDRTKIFKTNQVSL